MSQVQSGILPEHCRAAIWIEANLKGDVNALREASKIFVDNVATFQAKFPDAKLGAVVAFGNNVWRQLSGGEGADELKDFPVYGKGLAPSTQYDLLIHILSARHEVNFSVAQAALAAFGDAIDVKKRSTASAGWKSVTSAASSMAPKTRRGRAAAKWRSLKTAWMRAAATCSSSAGSIISNS